MTEAAIATLLTRLGIAFISGAVEVARALSGKTDAVEVRRRATEFLDQGQSEIAAAEERERRALANS